MEIRARLWPGLRTRSIWFEVMLALLSSSAVAIGAAAPEPQLVPDWALIVLGVLQVVTLVLFRRRAPLLPFVVSAVLAVVSPALTVGLLITSYAVGRYVGRWPLRIGAAVVGAIALVQPWTIGTANEAVGALGGVALAIVLPGAVGIWQRTRTLLLAALRD